MQSGARTPSAIARLSRSPLNCSVTKGFPRKIRLIRYPRVSGYTSAMFACEVRTRELLEICLSASDTHTILSLGVSWPG